MGLGAIFGSVALSSLLAAAAVGVPAGLGVYTFVHADGTSYFGTDPAQCANCHIMTPQLDGWQKASHHTAATCVDCHLPVSGIQKYVAKASNGWHHSKAFTTQEFHEPIQITPTSSEILQQNCLRCHGDLVDGMSAEGTSHAGALQCVHCHAAVGHGPQAGLGGPDRGVEQETFR